MKKLKGRGDLEVRVRKEKAKSQMARGGGSIPREISANPYKIQD